MAAQTQFRHDKPEGRQNKSPQNGSLASIGSIRAKAIRIFPEDRDESNHQNNFVASITKCLPSKPPFMYLLCLNPCCEFIQKEVKPGTVTSNCLCEQVHMTDLQGRN